jgi:hypothetical protein
MRNEPHCERASTRQMRNEPRVLCRFLHAADGAAGGGSTRLHYLLQINPGLLGVPPREHLDFARRSAVLLLQNMLSLNALLCEQPAGAAGDAAEEERSTQRQREKQGMLEKIRAAMRGGGK